MTGRNLFTAATGFVLLATAQAGAEPTSSAGTAQSYAPAGLVFPEEAGKLTRVHQGWTDDGTEYGAYYRVSWTEDRSLAVSIGVLPAPDASGGRVASCHDEFERITDEYRDALADANISLIDRSGSGQPARDLSDASLTANFILEQSFNGSIFRARFQLRLACFIDDDWTMAVFTTTGLHDSFEEDRDLLLQAIKDASS